MTYPQGTYQTSTILIGTLAFLLPLEILLSTEILTRPFGNTNLCRKKFPTTFMQQYIDTFMPFSTRNLLSADSLTKGLFEI